jgi:AcrR family transcriptional regulator
MTAKEEQVKQEIIKAAEALFQKHGINKTTMEDIAASMGKGKKYAYYYFKNKEEIFCEVINEDALRIMAVLDNALRNEISVAAKVRAFFSVRFNEVKKVAALYPAVLTEVQSHWPMISEVIKRHNTQFMAMLESLFREGIKNGEFKSISPDECHLLAIAGMALLRGAESQLIIDGEIPSDDMRCDALVKTFVRGLR